MINRDRDLEYFVHRYRITEITEEQDRVYSYMPYAGYHEYGDHIQRRFEKTVSVKISERGLHELMELASKKEREYEMLRIPQVRDAYERYKVIEHLYKKDF